MIHNRWIVEYTIKDGKKIKEADVSGTPPTGMICDERAKSTGFL